MDRILNLVKVNITTKMSSSINKKYITVYVYDWNKDLFTCSATYDSTNKKTTLEIFYDGCPNITYTLMPPKSSKHKAEPLPFYGIIPNEQFVGNSYVEGSWSGTWSGTFKVRSNMENYENAKDMGAKIISDFEDMHDKIDACLTELEQNEGIKTNHVMLDAFKYKTIVVEREVTLKDGTKKKRKETIIDESKPVYLKCEVMYTAKPGTSKCDNKIKNEDKLISVNVRKICHDGIKPEGVNYILVSKKDKKMFDAVPSFVLGTILGPGNSKCNIKPKLTGIACIEKKFDHKSEFEDNEDALVGIVQKEQCNDSNENSNNVYIEE